MYTLKQIADIVGGEIDERNCGLHIAGVSSIKQAKAGELAYVDDKYLNQIEDCQASAVIISTNASTIALPHIKVKHPRIAFAKLLQEMYKQNYSPEIHASASVGSNVKLGENVSIHHNVVIEDGAAIGDSAVLMSGVFIGRNTVIEQGVTIYPNVSVYHDVQIGKGTIIHSGTVIGADGFGFEWDGEQYVKIPHIGTVIIGEQVEIGANVTIDRGTLDATLIGKGTKIDNHVHIGHNVSIGEHCLIVAMTGIAGSTQIGHNVTIAGQVGIGGHLNIGDRSIILSRSGVTKSLPNNSFVSGYPARNHREELKVQALLKKVPQLFKRISELEKAIR